MLRTIRHSLIWVLLGVAISITCLYLSAYWRIHADNNAIQVLLGGQDVEFDSSTTTQHELQLARAYYLQQHKRYDEALATLNQIMEAGDLSLQTKARYNLGNIYLQQAVVYVENQELSRAIPLVELAKQSYRQALTLDSQYWDAKYNLEVAMRLLPEMERVNLEHEGPKQEQAELWTTVPGFPRGLP